MDLNIIKNDISQIEDESKRKFLGDIIEKNDKEIINRIDLVSFSKKLFNLAKYLSLEQINIYSKLNDLDQCITINSLLNIIPDDQVVENVISKDIFQKCFKQNYIKGNFHERLKVYLKDCIKYWINDKIYAPCALISQSSGHGKTRAIKEFANEEITLYICLQDSDDSYPYKSKIAATFIEAMNSKEKVKHMLSSLILASLDLIKDLDLEDAKKNIIKYQPWYYNPYQKSVKENKQCIEFYEKVKALFESQESQNEIENSNAQLQKKFSEIMKNQSLFVFIDEAAPLLENSSVPGESKFQLIRETIKEMFTKMKIAFIFADTNSRITTFIPKVLDSSKMLCKPFYATLFVDKLVPRTYLDSLKTLSYRKFKNRDPSLSIYCYGRPLWQSLLLQNQSGVVELAKRKIICANDWTNIENQKKYLAALALFGVRTTLSLSYNANFGAELVSRYMSTLFYNSENGEIAFKYISEPILAQGKCLLLYSFLTVKSCYFLN